MEKILKILFFGVGIIVLPVFCNASGEEKKFKKFKLKPDSELISGEESEEESNSSTLPRSEAWSRLMNDSYGTSICPKPLDQAKKEESDYLDLLKARQAEKEAQEKARQVKAQIEQDAKEAERLRVVAQQEEYEEKKRNNLVSPATIAEENRKKEAIAAEDMKNYERRIVVEVEEIHQNAARLKARLLDEEGVYRSMSDAEKKARRDARFAYLKYSEDVSYLNRLFAPFLSYFEFASPDFSAPEYDSSAYDFAQKDVDFRAEQVKISKDRNICFDSSRYVSGKKVFSLQKNSAYCNGPLFNSSSTDSSFKSRIVGFGNYNPKGFDFTVYNDSKYSPEKSWLISNLLFGKGKPKDTIQYVEKRVKDTTSESSSTSSGYAKYHKLNPKETEDSQQWKKNREELRKILAERLG